MTIIKKGYRFTLKTWENDADNYNTVTLEGLSVEVVKFYVELAKLHKSKNYHNNCFGNMYDPRESERAAYMQAMADLCRNHLTALKEINDDFEESWLDDEEGIEDVIHGVTYDLGLSGTDFYTRVTDTFKIEFVPQDIFIEDVTLAF